MSTDLVPTEDRHAAIDQYMKQHTFDDLVQMDDTYQIVGLALVTKEELVGVPHVITGITYWTPTAIGDYVSVEAVVASERAMDYAIARGWIPNVTSRDQLKLAPNERVVYNDGSTGIRRQITELLDTFGLISVGHDNATVATDTGNGKSKTKNADVLPDGVKNRFDLPWSEWESFNQTRMHGDNPVPSFRLNHEGNPLSIVVARGLSVSEYSNEFTGDTQKARTFYLR